MAPAASERCHDHPDAPRAAGVKPKHDTFFVPSRVAAADTIVRKMLCLPASTASSPQSMIMSQLSDGQKARIVMAKLAMEKPHLLMLDEPTNHLDMESIDSLAKAINKFQGGLVLVSHDMRLISQVAKEIWICDKKKVTRYEGEIMSFKMNMKKAQAKLAQHQNG